MKIFFKKNNTLVYQLDILYHYFNGDAVISQRFLTLSKFEEFMGECHPEISISKLVDEFNKNLAMLEEKSHDSTYDDEEKYICLNCAICGDELFVSKYNAGVTERMYRYKELESRSNDEYIYSVKSNSWTFKMENGIMRIDYWYDSNEATKPVYKIHAFKNRVILEASAEGNPSVLCLDKYYIHYGGKKKPS